MWTVLNLVAWIVRIGVVITLVLKGIRDLHAVFKSFDNIIAIGPRAFLFSIARFGFTVLLVLIIVLSNR